MLMSWKVREHYDNEAREQLRASFPDASLAEEAERAYDDSVHAIERKEAELWEIYRVVPSLLRETSQLSGVSESTLLTVARRIAATSRDTEWYQVLSTIRSYYRVKGAIEEKQQ